MKIKALTILFFVSFIYSYGQNLENIGLKGGISISTMKYKYYHESIDKTIIEKNGYKAGIYSALTAEFFKGKFLSLSIDLGFAQKGMIRRIPPDFLGSTGGSSYKSTREHVILSPMFKGFYEFNQLSIYALLGPRLDLDVTYALPPEANMWGVHPRWIWGLTYGAGAEFKLGKFGVLMECQVHPDITRYVSVKPTSGYSNNLEVLGNAFILTTGIKYYLH
jgi:hypothetical protein